MSPPIIETKSGKAWDAEYLLLHDLTNAAATVQVLIDLVEESKSEETRIECLRLLQISMQELSSRIESQKAVLDQASPQTSLRSAHRFRLRVG
jgi:hypothetical protein